MVRLMAGKLEHLFQIDHEDMLASAFA